MYADLNTVAAAAAAAAPEQVNVTYYFIILLYGSYPEPYVVRGIRGVRAKIFYLPSLSL